MLLACWIQFELPHHEFRCHVALGTKLQLYDLAVKPNVHDDCDEYTLREDSPRNAYIWYQHEAAKLNVVQTIAKSCRCALR